MARASERRWAIATPLAHIGVPKGVRALGEGVWLLPAEPEGTEWWATRQELKRLLGVELRLPARHEHELDGETSVDTRITGWLVSVEDGNERAAAHRAMTKARLLLAAWTVLKEPRHDRHMMVWPVAGEWFPQPQFQIEQRRGELDTERALDSGSTVIHSPDADALYVPPDGRNLTGPLRAIGLAPTHRPAARLLAASWSLYLTARPQTGLLWTDRW